MVKPDYSEFDAKLLNLIMLGKNRMMLLDQDRSLIEAARPFCRPGQPEFRVIDSRLQAMRKDGKIKHNGREWTLTT
ncbi:hypothetical protein K32_48900 [Kaistia sp. 32K]|uniref:hypothetical protein n=1 Tax=Kaistia sp. 32K TaxID=2795690 RepID=UPI0019158CB1|nr:hypothetical protein [Kaistia sp. 32K]BCP56273.1 hypothetical protein K32_48900 [Kaistia sp. 32K]